MRERIGANLNHIERSLEKVGEKWMYDGKRLEEDGLLFMLAGRHFDVAD